MGPGDPHRGGEGGVRRDTWRRDAASYPLRGEWLPRYTDVDVWQHLNNTALISIHGEAVQQALRSVFGPEAWRDSRPVLACTGSATDFLAEAHYPAPLTWGARVLGVDTEGVRIATALFQHDRCVGLHGATLAGWADGQRVGLGPDQVAALRAAQVPGADTMDPSGTLDVTAAAVPAPEHFSWRTTLAIRFADSDAHRLASDTFLARSAEQMRVEFLNRVFGGQRQLLGGMMVAHVSLRWLRRGAPASPWQLGCGVAHMGERSVAVRGAMFEAGRCVATCEAVMVAIDRESRRSTTLTDASRVLMEPYRLHESHAPHRA